MKVEKGTKTIKVNKELHKKLKKDALEREISLQELVEELLSRDYV